MRALLPAPVLAMLLLFEAGSPEDEGPTPLESDPVPKMTIQDPEAALRELREVEGSAVGYAGSPGEFYKLSKVFLAKGTEGAYRRLLRDNDVIVRAMALVCIAKTENDAGIPVLRNRLSELDEFTCFPGGCVGFSITEGTLAWHLLDDVNYLGDGWPKALLSDAELLEADLKILAAARLTHLHEHVAMHLAVRLTEGGDGVTSWPKQLVPARSDLESLRPKLTRPQAIKGLGRVHLQQRAFPVAGGPSLSHRRAGGLPG